MRSKDNSFFCLVYDALLFNSLLPHKRFKDNLWTGRNSILFNLSCFQADYKYSIHINLIRGSDIDVQFVLVNLQETLRTSLMDSLWLGPDFVLNVLRASLLFSLIHQDLDRIGAFKATSKLTNTRNAIRIKCGLILVNRRSGPVCIDIITKSIYMLGKIRRTGPVLDDLFNALLGSFK